MTNKRLIISYNISIFKVPTEYLYIRIIIIGCTHLEDSEQCDGKGVEVSGRRAFVEVELAAEKLHTEQREYEDEQEEQEEKGNDAAHRAQQRYHEVPQALPVFGDLKNSQESKGTQDGEAERAILQCGPDHLEDRAQDDYAVEAIEARFEVCARTERVDFYEHFHHEEGEEHKLCDVCK